ncbi:MAG: phage tail protein [Thiocapsa sp.]|nr:phage tail protein [Thiocapsa sp.]MCG6986092.1 phage tail protein [Thiocapsa sp.]
MNAESGFLHLNDANLWSGFHRERVEIMPDGVLCLASSGAGYTARGAFVGGPFDAPLALPWHRLRVHADPLHQASRMQLFTRVEAADTDLGDIDLAAEQPFPGTGGWHPVSAGCLDALIPGDGPRLWLGGILRGDGTSSPRIHQIRVGYGRDGWIDHLPAIYRRDATEADLLDRLLALGESIGDGLDRAISDLPRLFDPAAAPGEGIPSWLTWLAGWQAFELAETWSDDDKRTYLAEAFALHGKRGTREGLRRYLKLYAGVNAYIEEPARNTHLWCLDETSTLGLSTMLAPAHPQGAVLDATATLGESHLTLGEALGAALFEDLAHRFYVWIDCSQLDRPGALAAVHEVLEREKPAHTTYELCLIEPRMRVGAQARLGIDAIVAEGPPTARLGTHLGTGVLAEQAPACLDTPESTV